MKKCKCNNPKASNEWRRKFEEALDNVTCMPVLRTLSTIISLAPEGSTAPNFFLRGHKKEKSASLNEKAPSEARN
jgi:hypothetical protein